MAKKTTKNLSAELSDDSELQEHFGAGAVEAEEEEDLQEQQDGEEEGEEEEQQDGEEEGEEEGEEGEQQQTQEGAERQPKMVPHAALHAERQRVKALQDANVRAMARMNALMASQQRQAPQSFDRSQLPDMEQDPLGYIRGLETMIEQRTQADHASAVQQQVDQGIELDEASFQAIVPDYPDASEFFIQSRAAELSRFHSPQAIAAMLYNEVRQLARLSWQSGKSTAQTVYELAQQRGYRPNAGAPQQGQQSPQGQQQGQQPPAAAPRTQKQGQQTQQGDRLAAIRKGQRNSRSMGGSGGGGNTELNAEALLDMSDEEFEEYLGLGTKGANARFAAIAGN